MELGGGWNELGGGGRSWVELVAWFSNALLKVVLHTHLNVYWESPGGSRFVTYNLLVLYKWSQKRSTSCTNLIFPLNNFYQSVPIPFQNYMHCWWIKIKKSPKYKLNDSIGDLSKTAFWYHSNDTKRNPWLCCVHIAQFPAVYTLPFTLQLCYKAIGILQRVTKSQKVYISSHNVLQNLHNLDLAWHRSRDILKKEVEKQEFPAFPMKALENNQKLFFSNLIIYSPY